MHEWGLWALPLPQYPTFILALHQRIYGRAHPQHHECTSSTEGIYDLALVGHG